jgi:hypothetical protein
LLICYLTKNRLLSGQKVKNTNKRSAKHVATILGSMRRSHINCTSTQFQNLLKSHTLTFKI